MSPGPEKRLAPGLPLARYSVSASERALSHAFPRRPSLCRRGFVNSADCIHGAICASVPLDAGELRDIEYLQPVLVELGANFEAVNVTLIYNDFMPRVGLFLYPLGPES